VAFGEILEETRAALAKRYLAERDLPVSEIAWLLGYVEVSSFTNAFQTLDRYDAAPFSFNPVRIGRFALTSALASSLSSVTLPRIRTLDGAYQKWAAKPGEH